MERLAEIRVLPADLGPSRRELRVDERARERDGAARDPREQNQERRVNLPRDDVRVNEDARPDDAAHHDHRRVEHTQTPRQPTPMK